MRMLATGGVLSAAVMGTAWGCGIGDWGRTGQLVVVETCQVTVYSFTCGGPLGNEPQVTGVVGQFETGACPLV